MAGARGSSIRPQEDGLVLGLVLISILAALLFSAFAVGVHDGPIEPGLGTVLSGLYAMAWGVMFLLAYFFAHKTFFLRALMWMCEHASRPSGRIMALFYAAVGIGLGGYTVLRGLGPV
ncbi:MAG: hypothetical protein IAG13_28805 [Deltaproteobacteria bacterium]|nr:hypothetical protein [Nannocystaceae bacterium]